MTRTETKTEVVARKRVGGGAGSVARVFTQQPNRVAAAWRRVRFSMAPKDSVPENLLDDVVEPFVRELGFALVGRPGSPWARTQGVLRISPRRGSHGLYDEFSALRRCLTDAVEALGGGSMERALINAAVDEAVDSAVATCRKLENPRATGPEVPFGGLVVEIFDRPAPAVAPHDETSPVH